MSCHYGVEQHAFILPLLVVVHGTQTADENFKLFFGIKGSQTFDRENQVKSFLEGLHLQSDRFGEGTVEH